LIFKRPDPDMLLTWLAMNLHGTEVEADLSTRIAPWLIAMSIEHFNSKEFVLDTIEA